MKEKLEKQINKITELSDKTNQLFNLNAAFLIEQKKTPVDLEKCLRAEFEQLDFEFFERIMEGEEYDAEIHYDQCTRRECNRILMLKEGEPLPKKFDRSTVYLKRKADGTIEEYWYQNGKKRGVHTRDIKQATKIINFFINNQAQEVIDSTQSQLFDEAKDLCSYRTWELTYNSPLDIPEPIKRLKEFFDSKHYTPQEKEKVEKILIFATFLQATWDLFTQLNESSNKFHELLTDEFIDSAKQALFNYLYILDNIAYKCRPDAYKLLSFLVALPISAGISLAPAVGFAILFSPFMIIGIISGWGIPCVIVPIVGAGCVFLLAFAFLGLGKVCSILFTHERIEARWNRNWAYRLPECAIQDLKETNAPTDFGIFPAVLSLPPHSKAFNITKDFPGTSFKAMNRLGFFPFKETATKAIEIAENVEKNLGYVGK